MTDLFAAAGTLQEAYERVDRATTPLGPGAQQRLAAGVEQAHRAVRQQQDRPARRRTTWC
ncbi:hypothetical protein ACPCHT_01570 [Nucisporomicrobium flavum]|uniref:hypothetical protein n=1 Tax=Nucisporomicrobium flavum TaxID=2785915 RepID=UPI003C2BBA55